jgi:molybdopterin-binding protein
MIDLNIHLCNAYAVRCRLMPRVIPIGEAAQALGVSLDTLRRWDREGRLQTERDARGRRLVSVAEVQRLGGHLPTRAGDSFSARNRFEGVVESVEVSGVVAQVVIQAGPYQVVSIVTRDAVEELGLAPGVPAVATVKATSVMIGRP